MFVPNEGKKQGYVGNCMTKMSPIHHKQGN